jgi:hypothetical protein
VRSFGIPFSGDTDGHVSGVVLIDEASGVLELHVGDAILTAMGRSCHVGNAGMMEL